MPRQPKPRDAWEPQEAGWYIHPRLGGICKETAETAPSPGWYWYPLEGPVHGPFKTLRAALQQAAKKIGG